ncbi:DoxX family protein [Longimonas halophila]|uniref:DoxX family protein n=2 Tax=Longimonas halophila TaxID=1469170 RepID=A0A2H3NTH0_9BACT|nr:DoxX family protein [Longimonas halophila]
MTSNRKTAFNIALLVLRIGIGISFVFVYGYEKILGGPETWTDLGSNMAVLGITFWPVVWGFMAAFAEFVGGILLMLGFVFRPALVILSGTMIVAAIGHTFGDIGGGPWHATEMLTVFIALLITGPGAYSLDTLFFGSSDPYA